MELLYPKDWFDKGFLWSVPDGDRAQLLYPEYWHDEGVSGVFQMVIELLYPEYARPVAQGVLQPDARQALFLAFRDRAVAAKAAFEAGLHNQLSPSADSPAGCR